MKTKVAIISGFLGAGKTTFINKLLSGLVNGESVVIIENEYGDIGIDSNLINGDNAKVKEMNNGCICCTLSTDFIVTLASVIVNNEPDWVIVEPTGIGQLSDVINACNQAKRKCDFEIEIVTTIVDGVSFGENIQMFGSYFINQIENGKNLVISRSDEMSKAEVDNVIKEIVKINAKTRIFSNGINTLTGKEWLEILQEKKVDVVTTSSKCSHGIGCKCGNEKAIDKSKNIDSWSYYPKKNIKKEKFIEMINALNSLDIGCFVRMKGVFTDEYNQKILFNCIANKTEFNINEKIISEDKMIFIGKNINTTKLENELIKCMEDN